MSLLRKNIDNLKKRIFVFHIRIFSYNFIISIKELKIIRINHTLRSQRYKRYIKDRILKVASAYMINQIQFNDKKSNIIDIGANIGEIGIYFNYFKKKKINYYAFEPLENEFNCIKFNVKKSHTFNFALSDKNEKKNFFVKSDSNDSSFIKFSDYDELKKLDSYRLDTIPEIIILKKIHLIKIDAEGFEPEVIKGCKNILQKVEFITIDCGPERNNKPTSKNVIILLKKKFKIVNRNKTRGTILFKNRFI